MGVKFLDRTRFMPVTKPLGRRRALMLAAALPLVHIRSAAAAGKLSIMVPDHWVQEGNVVLRRQIEAWEKRRR